jgi:hypothetical protein
VAFHKGFDFLDYLVFACRGIGAGFEGVEAVLEKISLICDGAEGEGEGWLAHVQCAKKNQED